MATDWATEQAKRVGDEVHRLRADRSAQWLSDRTAAIGMRVARTTISELETGRRKHVTVAELCVLAAALDTAPTALLFPGPYAPADLTGPTADGEPLKTPQWISEAQDWAAIVLERKGFPVVNVLPNGIRGTSQAAAAWFSARVPLPSFPEPLDDKSETLAGPARYRTNTEPLNAALRSRDEGRLAQARRQVEHALHTLNEMAGDEANGG